MEEKRDHKQEYDNKKRLEEERTKVDDYMKRNNNIVDNTKNNEQQKISKDRRLLNGCDYDNLNSCNGCSCHHVMGVATSIFLLNSFKGLFND